MTERNKSNNNNIEKERQYLYWLTQVPGLGAVKIKKLLEWAGSFEAVYNMKEQELEKLFFLNKSDKYYFGEHKKFFMSRQEDYHRLGESGIKFITTLDSEYPKRLREIYDMPAALFVKGKLPEENIPSAAVIGARSCSYYGRTEAEYIGKTLAEHGVQVISGLAYGIDGAGHKGVLSASGEAYAVLGSGIDNCYPRENWNLYLAIQEKGGIISEYAPGTSAEASHFPIRNRIISGLSDAVIIIEARKRSGSLITAELALEQGKEIFALPGRVTDPLSMGCNELIKEGAAPFLTPADVLDFLGIKLENSIKLHGKNINGLAKNEKKVYSCLDSHPKHVEEVMSRSGLAAGECMAVLLKLELGGYVVQETNQYYVRKLE